MSSLYTRLKITLGKANASDDVIPHLESDAEVSVSLDDPLVFRPATGTPRAGIIFYQGGRCDPLAYAPVLRPLAAAGYLVCVPQMPLRLAVLGMNRAADIITANSDVRDWVIGGHSMGGAMAAAFVYKNPQAVRGLFFLASYASSMHAMPESSLPMAMIYGTHDTITRKSEFEASYERLPAHTKFVPVEGGDHYQFGSFAGAINTATIAPEEQHRQTVQALLGFLDGAVAAS